MLGWLCKNLDERMNEYIHKSNGKQFHPYKPHVITLRSRQILRCLNKVTNIDEKHQQLDLYYEKMTGLLTKCYNEFDPTFIYMCNDELHFVFFYNDEGDFRYNGNIHKTMSALTSFVSIHVSRIFPEFEYFYYTTRCIEFDTDYETLNYLIWRQTNSTNNNFQTFYRCLYPTADMKNLTIANMHFELMRTKMDILSFTNIYGVIMKRQTNGGFYKTSFDISTDFDQVFKMYFEQKTIKIE